MNIEENTIKNNSEEVIGGGKAFIEKLLERMGLSCSVEEKIRRGELCYYLKGSGASALIGHRGETLDALQHIVLQAAKNTGSTFERVIIDADFYRQKRETTLTGLAQKLERKAYSTSTVITLEPMNPAERRIIHSALQDSKYVTTHSEGEGRDRHIVIVPNEAALAVSSSSAPSEKDEEQSIAYGGSNFSRKGPSKTRSFGYKKNRF